jgi:hypothetical protein
MQLIIGERLWRQVHFDFLSAYPRILVRSPSALTEPLLCSEDGDAMHIANTEPSGAITARRFSLQFCRPDRLVIRPFELDHLAQDEVTDDALLALQNY